MNRKDIEDDLLYSLYLNYKSVFDYIFNNHEQINFAITYSFVKSALFESLAKKTDEWFNYLLEEFKKIKPTVFTFKLYTKLLNQACLNSHLSVAKEISEIILNKSPDYDFCTPFSKALSSGSTSICQYFFDKKVYINYEQISLHVSELGSIDKDIFSILINKVDQTTKYKYMKCIDKAIKKKNKKLIEFLLTENAPADNALFEAVSTHDLEIVDLILKYKSDPSFINQKMQKDQYYFMQSMEKILIYLNVFFPFQELI